MCRQLSKHIVISDGGCICSITSMIWMQRQKVKGKTTSNFCPSYQLSKSRHISWLLLSCCDDLYESRQWSSKGSWTSFRWSVLLHHICKYIPCLRSCASGDLKVSMWKGLVRPQPNLVTCQERHYPSRCLFIPFSLGKLLEERTWKENQFHRILVCLNIPDCEFVVIPIWLCLSYG
ncbi:unnamed protein product [Cyberlindnera jadinii]|uniref:Uncharacterized protein n=1 Tax=Cyberlindnera jadinii (strain ATCC 18201 / CBS 1600 / BCRC 20928 / JCM 3617 / NBRC 0987 / NRRL Y-1542) TaxID=983966 RepID=A0A0H5C9A4_CYBJN|nr:unnamed protein product [Cyberlindnera jadinii]